MSEREPSLPLPQGKQHPKTKTYRGTRGGVNRRKAPESDVASSSKAPAAKSPETKAADIEAASSAQPSGTDKSAEDAKPKATRGERGGVKHRQDNPTGSSELPRYRTRSKSVGIDAANGEATEEAIKSPPKPGPTTVVDYSNADEDGRDDLF